MKGFGALGIITRNFGWKVLALGISMALWFAIVGDSQLGTSVKAPLQFRNMPDDLEISNDLPEEVTLEVRGPSRRLRSSELSDAVCRLDLAAIRSPGESTFTIRESNVVLPHGVTMDHAVPSQIRIVFEERVVREAPVRLRLTGNLPEGVRLTGQRIVPDHVRVAGPRSHVERVEAVETDAISLSSATADTELVVHVYAGNPQVRLESSSTVTVRLMLERTASGAPAAAPQQ